MSIVSKIQAVRDIIGMKIYRNKPEIKSMSIEETINLVVENQLSVSRYGDGEVFMMANLMNDSFQTYDRAFAKRLKEVINKPIDGHLTCVSVDWWHNLDIYVPSAREWFAYFTARKSYLYKKYFNPNVVYGNSCITRLYMDYVDKSQAKPRFDMLKKIWQDRDIVFVEGEFSRLGVGNDLFDNARSIERILVPATNAYDRYDDIVSEVSKLAKDKLILLAVGATATVLAYDLCKLGYQAVDVGHVDIEYMWMQMGVTEKVPLKGKYVNEIGEAGRCRDSEDDQKYNAEIIAKIL